MRPAGSAPGANPLKAPAGQGAPDRLDTLDLLGKASIIDPDPAWIDAAWAAALCAVDPSGLGGVVVRAAAGPVRDLWTTHLRSLLPPGEPLRRMPSRIADERLLGGLDLAATLASGRPVRLPGLLAQTDRGVLLLPMAERLSAQRSAQLAAVLDRGEVEASRSADGQVRCV